ncbi:unnamed protein product [Darwinula stevensoni]|uniref:J domain-containing protein n=1 Tax=Darwinula stevensoni TaxID=69355 RepID=A0A7R8X118_9CRUS|nr:unnamed protein product [Darwinula stevensoni]CAG0881785.1 unnamed protein product [Darwinula stevensoni]
MELPGLKHLDPEVEQPVEEPPFSLSRFGGELFLALVWGHWWNAAVPRDPIFGIDISFLRLLAPVFVAAAVHTVGNIGNQQGSFMKPLISSYLLYTLNGFHDRAITSAALSATIGFNWRAKEWRRVKEPKGSLRKRLLKTAVVVVFSYGLVVSFLYFNCEVRDNSGVSTKCRDALQNFLNSPAWVDMKTQLLRIYEVIKLHGWSRVYEEIINSIDPLGEKKALEILELSQGASQENITAQYRSLSRKYHPDRYKDPEEKIKAQEKFIEIQQAYERLSDIKTKRKRANKKPSDQGTTNEFSQGPDDVNNDDDEDFIHDRDL